MNTEATKKRLYVVTDNSGNDPVYHLIRAASKSAALSAVVTPRFTAGIADVETVANLMSKGVAPKDAA